VEMIEKKNKAPKSRAGPFDIKNKFKSTSQFTNGLVTAISSVSICRWVLVRLFHSAMLIGHFKYS